MKTLVAAALLVVGLVGAGPAFADNCEAIPDGGPMPSYLSFGNTFSGPMVEVIDLRIPPPTRT